jgi:predicted nucleotidyltransferase
MKITKNTIISTLKKIKPIYEKEGLILIGLFGSYAKDEQNNFSDIDIAYKINYNKFSTKYKDGFSKILIIEEIKQEL